MGQIDKTTSNYINNLEDKIVELSLKLKANEQELNELKTQDLELFKNYFHDLKNSLGNTLSFSNIILDNEESLLSEKEKKYLSIIQNSSEFSFELIHSFSKLYKLKKDHKTVEIENVNLIDIINEEVELLKEPASKRGISLKFNKPSEEIALISNKNSIKSILNSLIDNAIRFSKNNFKIKIEIINCDGKIEIKVIDNGIGISKENLPKIYNEFFVCNTYAVDKTKCIGLGLSISRIIAKKLNAKLRVESELDKGTVASLIFVNQE